MIWVDRIATTSITLGGTAVIVAVLGILVYLAAVVWPLFAGATLEREGSFPLVEPAEAASILYAEIDEYRSVGLALLKGGEAISFTIHDRARQRFRLLPAEPAITAASRADLAGAALGFADGTVRIASLGFEVTFPSEGSAQAAAEPGRAAIAPLPSGGLRKSRAEATVEPPLDLPADPAPVRLIDYRAGDPVSRIAVYREGRTLVLGEIQARSNLVTGAITRETTALPIAIPPDAPAGDPAFLLLTTTGDQVYLAWSDGQTLRWDLRDPTDPLLAERARLLGDPEARLTALRFMPGEQSILAADSQGGITIWFRIATESAGPDGFQMVAAHRFPPEEEGIALVAATRRDKSFLTATRAGTIALHHMTSERRLASATLSPRAAPVAAQITPKNDGLFVLGGDGAATLFALGNPHPETSFSSLFGPIWYEGYAAPGYTWQSSGGTDDFEPKLSLVPLLFGTFKATLYSMIFAVPIALCAAIYTSEFLERRMRASIKSVVEVMAALPSVVLGFLAALVLAPLVESWALAVLSAFAIVPLAALLSGYLWQVLPPRATFRLSAFGQFAIMGLTVLAAIAATPWLASTAERILFEGDFRAWLDLRAGGAGPGIGLASWPPILTALLIGTTRFRPKRWRRGTGWTELGRFLLLLALSIALAFVVGAAGSALGLDLRGALIGTYVQRNALVVGFVMGFAVIPIIYTIAEDALSTVPQSLRSASLGCGATRWQTATRVVLPVAASGIFSALMVGLGRAVGETMIVLMAAGNTPLIDMNLFNGLRTLSANIAVELPEAARNGTLFRVLFLAALLLFCLTFVVNTLAELVRQRFRRRAYQL